MREVTIDDLSQALDQGTTVVDVREPGEYAEGHIPESSTSPQATCLPASTNSTATSPPRSSVLQAIALLR